MALSKETQDLLTELADDVVASFETAGPVPIASVLAWIDDPDLKAAVAALNAAEVADGVEKGGLDANGAAFVARSNEPTGVSPLALRLTESASGKKKGDA